MRQVLELDTAGGDGGVGVIRKHVAAPHLDGIDAEPISRLLEQVFTDGVADRMTDGAVLRAWRLVQINHGGPRPVVFVTVWTARDGEDLVGFEHARARVLRIGAGTRKHVNIKPYDLARTVYRNARLDGIFPRVDVGHKRFQPVGDELDRTAEFDRRRHRCDLVTITVDLQAKRAADIGRNDLHVVVGNTQRLCKYALDHVRALTARGDGKLAGRLVVGGEQRAWLQTDPGMPTELEPLRNDHAGAGKCSCHAARLDALAKGEIVAEFGMQSRGMALERGALVGDRWQLLPIDADQLGGVLRPGAGICDHDGDGLARPAGAVDRHGVLRRRLHARKAAERADPWSGAEFG